VNGSVCLVQPNGNVINNGRMMVFTPNVDPILISQGFYIGFTTGDTCLHENAHRMTTIQIICSIVSTRPALAPVYNNNTCEANFIWSSIVGCPVCTDADYKKTYGDCVGGTQTVVFTRMNICNGEQVIQLDNESCSISFNFPMGVVIASAIAFVALLAVAIFVFIKNRRISYQYNRLQETYSGHRGGQVELDNIETKKDENFSIDTEE